MFSNYCCCCFKTNEILLPITIKSSSEDSKMFLDYYSSIFGEFLSECNSFDFICIRCSKALQVAYHFINMVKENQSTSFPNKNEETILNDASFKEIKHKIQDKQATPSSTSNNTVERNKFNTECEVECQTNKSSSSNELVPLSSPENFEVLSNDSNAEPESSAHPKEYNLDFMCIICNELFKNKLCFFEHNRQQHKEIVPYKCKLCSFYTCYTESLFKHREKNHGLSDVAIDFYETKLAVAPVSPSFGTTYVCTSCDFKSRDQTSIDEHLVKEHSIEEDVGSFVKEIFHCPLCYRSFMALKSAKIHYSMYHMCFSKENNMCSNKRKFSCEKCGKLFDLKSGLFLHRRICEELKPVACNFCKLQFTSVLKYERHLQERHSVAIRHECEICGKTFSCSEYLTVHRKRHNERYYQCELCPKNYISNADLKVHKHRIHAIKHTSSWATCSNLPILKSLENKKQIFKCSYCDFVSHSSYANKTHQYKHKGCMPYKCQICSKEFVFRKSLKQHIEKNHATSLTNDELAESFKKTHGYSARFDGFSKQNTALEINEVNEFKLEKELEEFGLTSDDIMKKSNSEMQNKKSP